MPDRRLSLLLPGLVAAGLGLGLAGCVVPGAPGAQTAAAAAEENFNDPYEETNRAIFDFNQTVDKAVLRPVAEGYRDVVPDPVRRSVHNVLLNLNGPVIFANDVLQGHGELAANTLGRLAVNTTLGLGGILDLATPAGIPYHPNDFGATLATWGFGEGPYVMLPVLGPSNPRDVVGQVADGFADPANIIAGQHHLLWATVARTATSGIDVRSRNIETLAEIERTSLDYYATIRSLYRQRREALIRHEQTDLPNPTPITGSSGPDAPMSYTPTKPPTTQEVPPK